MKTETENEPPRSVLWAVLNGAFWLFVAAVLFGGGYFIGRNPAPVEPDPPPAAAPKSKSKSKAKPAPADDNSEYIWVKGYYRADGKWVEPYKRRKPNRN
ncbi:MAG: hypothetical protein OEY28_00055 [Nitrospira sp.]|nr:hypothetical protein [Nitrospira sp.]